MKKVIIIILITATIASIFTVFLFRPKPAKAFLGIGDIVADVLGWLKDFFLDRLPKIVARYAMVRLQQEIIRWAQGGYTDQNQPFAMFNWRNEIIDALNLASAKFLEEYHLTKLCAPFRFTIGTTLGLTTYYGIPYTEYAACSLDTIINNVGQFWQNPSITVYGWNAWQALAQPQNNIFGSTLLAAERMAEIQTQEIAEKQLQKDTGGGYKNENECKKYQEMSDEELMDCNLDCSLSCIGDPNRDLCELACSTGCNSLNTGICLEYKTKNPGSIIHSAIEKTVGSDIDWLISADEISEMFNLVFSKFFNKLIHGTGITKQPIYRATQSISKYQAQYGYQAQYKKAQTPEDIQNLRKDILENIRKAIQSQSGTSYECNKDYQSKGDVYAETATEIIEEESQHMYTSTEGVDLKPDFQVLDPGGLIGAVGVVPLGRTWDDITFVNYPEKCQKITGSRCQDTITNLPYELDYNNINSECTTGCLQQINSYRVQCESAAQTCINNCNANQTCINNCRTTQQTCYNTAITNAVRDGKCSSNAVAIACQQGGALIEVSKSRCEDCMQKALKTCENETDEDKKNACIELNCSNYQDYAPLAALIIDAQDFYARCSLNELKNSCYVCLKEYFMPAHYCEVIYDFVNRAFVNYPALVYDSMWWGMYNPQSGCTNNRTDDKAQVEVGLICRILPNNPICQTSCTATPEEFKNIYDDEPNSSDCNPFSVDMRAYSPGSQYLPYLFKQKAKCCVALTNNPTIYASCRGSVASAPAQGLCAGATVQTRPECFCKDNERPLASAKNLHPDYICPNVDGVADGTNCWSKPGEPATQSTCRNACSAMGFTVPNNMSGLSKAYIETNAAPGGGIVYVGTDSCSDNRDCRAGITKAKLFEKLAKIFKPLIPFAEAAPMCTCDNDTDCPLNYFCDDTVYCTGGAGFGVCVYGGTCDCDIGSDCASLGSGYICDLGAPEAGKCNAGQYNGLCTYSGGNPDQCTYPDDYYIFTDPRGTVVCSQEAPNTTNSKACCSNNPETTFPGLRTAEFGVKFTCDMTGQGGNRLYFGIYANQESDCQTSAVLCVPCNTADANYNNGYYETSRNQCTGKIPVDQR